MGVSVKSNRSKAVMSEINVTPFVDVMLVLLIIFMVTAPMMSQGIDVNLPKTTSSGMSVTEDPFIIYVKTNQRIEIAETPVNLNQLKDKSGLTLLQIYVKYLNVMVQSHIIPIVE